VSDWKVDLSGDITFCASYNSAYDPPYTSCRSEEAIDRKCFALFLKLYISPVEKYLNRCLFMVEVWSPGCQAIDPFYLYSVMILTG
jgi:hypothetical protein